jgi:hypothetical protein
MSKDTAPLSVNWKPRCVALATAGQPSDVSDSGNALPIDHGSKLSCESEPGDDVLDLPREKNL